MFSSCCGLPVDMYYQDILFYPGVTGVKTKRGSNKISHVGDDTQAKKNNVQVGWTITEIEGQQYSFDLFMEYRNGDEPYWLTFSSSQPIRNVPHQVIQSDEKVDKPKVEISDSAPAIRTLSRDEFLTYEIPTTPNFGEIVKGQKGRYTHFVKWDDKKQGGRYFECNIDDSQHDEAAENSVYVVCHDGDAKFVAYSDVFTLELATDLGPVIAYWEKGTRSYAFSGQATAICADKIQVNFNDGDHIFVPKEYVYQKQAISNPHQIGLVEEVSIDAPVGFFGSSECIAINDHSIDIGTEVRLLASEDEFKSAFEHSKYSWDDAMVQLLGARVTVVDRPQLGVFGLPACIEDDNQPIWWYPFSVIKNIVDVEAEAKLYIVTAEHGEALYSGTQDEILSGDAKYEGRCTNQAVVERLDDELYLDKYGFYNGYFRVLENEYEGEIGKLGYLGIKTVTQKAKFEEEERKKKFTVSKPEARPTRRRKLSIEPVEEVSIDAPVGFVGSFECSTGVKYIVSAEYGDALYSGTADQFITGEANYEGRVTHGATLERMDNKIYKSQYGMDCGLFTVLTNDYSGEIGKIGYVQLENVTVQAVQEEEAASQNDEPNYYFDKETHNSIKSTLNTFDSNGDGQIDPEEFRYALECAGKFVTDKELLLMISDADLNGDGIIDMDEFVHAFGNATN